MNLNPFPEILDPLIYFSPLTSHFYIVKLGFEGVYRHYFLMFALNHIWGPQGFSGSGEKGYLFSGSWGALQIILGELGSKHILLGI